METRSNNLKRHVTRMHPEVAPAVPEVAPAVPEVAPAVPEVTDEELLYCAENIVSCFPPEKHDCVVIKQLPWLANKSQTYVLSIFLVIDIKYFNYEKFQTLFPNYMIELDDKDFYRLSIYKNKTPAHGYSWNKPDGSYGGFIECGCENQECSV